ncbi:MAG TPA: beta-galactosidase [Bacteroidales bacterium]|nr:beta-galactosidase [Bacteroidales bacterium]
MIRNSAKHFQVRGENFYLDGKKSFLLSGEIHYFRIRRELWEKHLDAALEAGLTTISTYVPWAWHEFEEGVFDFNGISCPERDLTGWLSMCRQRGLNAIVKPGPFILAEYRGAGLPDWFMDRCREKVKMRTSGGKIVASDGVSLFNREYLEKVTRWYDRVMPLIRDHRPENGGPVILMQVCNEIGVFSWLARQADYGNAVKERFVTFLEDEFSSVEALNRLWGTDYQRFDQVELPPDGTRPYASSADRARDVHWHRFWRKYYAAYLEMLTRMVRERGVTVPVYHNLPGWIYGHGYEFPVNITMYDELFGDKSELMFGVDHIPEFLSHRNMHDDRIINDIVRAMQGPKPLFAAEFQCGSREYHVVTNPRESELFYKASLAHGLTGWNYYMFSQGRNPERKGYSGSTFYWFNPLTAEGERTSLFATVKRMNRLIGTAEEIITEARRRAEICVLFYPPYYATELERPETGSWGLTFVPSSIRRPAYFDGLLKALQVLNIEYDMADLAQCDAESLKPYRQVWAFCTDEMDVNHQATLAGYSRSGGNLVIFPFLSDRTLAQEPCTLLRDAIGIRSSGIETIDSPLIDILGFRDIKCANPLIVYPDESLKGAEIIARTLNGSACGFTLPLGDGSVTHLGTWIGFDTEGHKPVYEALVARSEAVLRRASSGNEFITVRERFTLGGCALLFIGNYYNEEQVGKVTYTHPESSEEISLPYSGGAIVWPALYAVVTPVGREVTPGLKILHSTSDILEIRTEGENAELVLYGDRDLAGEIVFEGPAATGNLKAVLDDENLTPLHKDGRTVFHYSHKHHKEMLLRIF